MPSRRYHKKSRLGCAECKVRRVKCDEARPTCGGCIRVGTECHYPTKAPSSAIASPSSPAFQRSPGVPMTPPATSTPSTITSEPCFSPNLPSFDLLDLRLMHHFTASTSQHLFSGERQAHVWRHEIPALAASHAMVMHALLAVSALHLARTDISNRAALRTRALHHHGAGLRPFHEQIAQLSPVDTHSEALITFSILLGVYVYAFPETAGERMGLGEMLDMLEIVRGCKTVFMLHRDAVRDKPIGVFIGGTRKHHSAHVPDELLAKDVLEPLRAKAALEIFQKPINELERGLNCFLEGVDVVHMPLSWIAMAEDAFWALLKTKDPMALLVFAHHAIAMRCVQKQCWWIGGWWERHLEAVKGALSTEDKDMLEWDEFERRIREQGEVIAESTTQFSTPRGEVDAMMTNTDLSTTC